MKTICVGNSSAAWPALTISEPRDTSIQDRKYVPVTGTVYLKALIIIYYSLKVNKWFCLKSHNLVLNDQLCGTVKSVHHRKLKVCKIIPSL